MIKWLIKFAVKKFKGRNLFIDSHVTNTYLLGVIIRQFIAMLRGLVKLQKLVFLGKSVTIRAKHNMDLSRGVTIGDYSNLDAMGVEGLTVGGGSAIGSFSILKVSGTLASIGKGIQIGENVGLGDFTHIGGAGGVSIGDDTIAGAYLSIHPENHNFTDSDILIREQGVSRKGVVIGKNCWIGAKVTFLDGSSVGSGCVIAAGAIVNGVFPNNVVIGGVPAKILKEINHD